LFGTVDSWLLWVCIFWFSHCSKMFPTFITDKTEKKGKYFHISNMRREKKRKKWSYISTYCRVREMCQTWLAKFGQILARTYTRLVFCNKKLMRTDIFFTRTTKPICNFVNPAISQGCITFYCNVIESMESKTYR
jgi:hypothetical protein